MKKYKHLNRQQRYTITDEYVKMVLYKLNNRPRKKLNYISFKTAFFKCVDEFCT